MTWRTYYGLPEPGPDPCKSYTEYTKPPGGSTEYTKPPEGSISVDCVYDSGGAGPQQPTPENRIFRHEGIELRWTWDRGPNGLSTPDPGCPVILLTVAPPSPRLPVGPYSCLIADPFYRLALAARLETGDRREGLRALDALARDLEEGASP